MINNPKITEKIKEVLKNVGFNKGIVCIEDIEHDIGIQGKYVDYYMVTSVLADLIENNAVSIEFHINDFDEKQVKDYEYLLKLLKNIKGE